MSELFDITTDYILNGILPVFDENKSDNKFASQVLFIASTAFVFIGLFCAFDGWYEKQTMEAVWGSMITGYISILVFKQGWISP